MDNTPQAPQGGDSAALSGQVMFYKQPEPLAAERHGNLGVKRIDRPFAFLKEAHAVPVTVSEFGMGAGSFPLIFVGQDKTPVAVMGIRQNQNLYVGADGQPDPDVYLPAFVRRYPFVFASDNQSDRLLLCVDRAAPMVSDQPDVPFFNGQEPSQFTNDAIEFCKEFERQRRATVEFTKLIESLDLFETKSVAFTPRDAQGNTGEQQKIADYWAISEEKLNALSPEQYMQLRDNGAIGAVYAHMVSLLNWPRVIQRAFRTPTQAQNSAAAGQVPQPQPGM